jgi:hypothetical protein
MSETTLSLLAVKAWEVAALLNSIDDPDEREAAREKFEQVLNDELFHGSMNRSLAAGTGMILDAVFGDSRLHSVRVDDPERVRRLEEYRLWKAGLPS